MFWVKLGLASLQKRPSLPGPNWLMTIILSGTAVPKSVVSVAQLPVLDFLEPSLVAFRQVLTVSFLVVLFSKWSMPILMPFYHFRRIHMYGRMAMIGNLSSLIYDN